MGRGVLHYSVVESMQKLFEAHYADSAGTQEQTRGSQLHTCGPSKPFSAASAETFGLCCKVEIKAENSKNFSFSALTMVTADRRGGRQITCVPSSPPCPPSQGAEQSQHWVGLTYSRHLGGGLLLCTGVGPELDAANSIHTLLQQSCSGC